MPTCSVFGCTNRSKLGGKVQYFGFPLKNDALLDAWITAIRREGFKPTKSSKICSVHFEESDYLVQPGIYMRHLKPGAVPSVFPGFPKHFQTIKSSRRALFKELPVSNNVSVQTKEGSNMSVEMVDKITALEQNFTCMSICKSDKSSQTDDNNNAHPRRQIKPLQEKVRRRDKRSDLEKYKNHIIGRRTVV